MIGKPFCSRPSEHLPDLGRAYARGFFLMKFVKLTDPDGRELWIAPRWVTKVRQPIPGRHPQNANALVVMGSIEQSVIETVQQVLKILEEAPSDA